VFSGRIVDVVHDIVTLPDGRSALREVVKHPGGAAVLPVTADGKLVFVRQYRHPLGGLALEIPAGMVDPGETHLECAARELEEEVGFKSSNVVPFLQVSPSPGYLSEKLHIFLATDLTPSRRNLDDEEFIDVEFYTPEEAVSMIFGGAITDAKTVTAVLAYRVRSHSS